MSWNFMIKRRKLESGDVIGPAEYFILDLIKKEGGIVSEGKVWAESKKFFRHINRTMRGMKRKGWIVDDVLKIKEGDKEINVKALRLTVEGSAAYSEAKYHYEELMRKMIEDSGKE